MKKTLRNIFIIIVVILLTVVSVLPIFAAEPPFSEESYWNKTCGGIGYTADNAKKCQDYKSYLKEQAAKDKDSLKGLKYNIEDIKANSKKYEAEAKDYEEQVAFLEGEVKAIEDNITTTQNLIKQLENEIAEKEISIEEKEVKVKNYISVSQAQSRVNGYVEFMMGATNFSDIIMRFEGLNRIKVFNENLIAELTAERETLEEDKAKTETSKVALENSKELLVIQKETMITMVAKAVALHKEQEKMASQLEAQAALLNEKVALTEKQQDEIKQFFPPPPPPPAPGTPPPAPPNSGSWTHPLSGSAYRVGSWGYKYRSGSLKGLPHTGADYTTGRARVPLKMPGDGIVVIANDLNCPNGSLTSSCGNGWGNYVSMLVLIEGQVYGVSMAHLTAGTIPKGLVGKPVRAGTVVGNVGTSGMSTGIHLHIEMFRTNYNDIQAAFNAWSGDRYFGAVNRFCHSNGNQAPCKVDAPLLLGDMSLTPGYYN